MARAFQSLYDWCKENNKQNLIDEWDYDKNFPLTPKDVPKGSNKIVYWKCKNNHSWSAKIVNRKNGRGCRYCSNRRLLIGFNDFATVHPELLSEWDYDKNGDLKPEHVMSGSKTVVWWKCPFGHSYQSDLNHRTSPKPTGCKVCFSGRQTSFREQAFYYYIHKIFPDAISRYKCKELGAFELDIYIPSISTAIEYDGIAWHKEEKYEREKRKYLLCKKMNIKLIRIKEKMPDEWWKDYADEMYTLPNPKDFDNNKELTKLIHTILERITRHFRFIPYYINPIDVNLDRDRFEISYYKTNVKDSFGDLYPELAKEWHPTKNGLSKPTQFKPRSDFKAWWICPICSHEYQTTIGHRVEGTGCKICGIKKSTKVKCKKVAKCDLKSKEIIEVYDSISDAGRKNKISTGNIASVCTGKRPSASGYFWKYYKED